MSVSPAKLYLVMNCLIDILFLMFDEMQLNKQCLTKLLPNTTKGKYKWRLCMYSNAVIKIFQHSEKNYSTLI